MAKVFNPWESPPTTGTLTGDLASFEINGMDGPEDSGAALEDSTSESESETPEPEDMMMQQALQVISQQAELISKLMKSLGKSA